MCIFTFTKQMVYQPTPSATVFKNAKEFNVTCEYLKEFRDNGLTTIPSIISQNSEDHILNKMGTFLYASSKKKHNWSLLSSDINMYRTTFISDENIYEPPNKVCNMLWKQISNSQVYIARNYD